MGNPRGPNKTEVSFLKFLLSCCSFYVHHLIHVEQCNASAFGYFKVVSQQQEVLLRPSLLLRRLSDLLSSECKYILANIGQFVLIFASTHILVKSD